MSNHNTQQQVNVLWSNQPKANAELFALTYGALVGELIRDFESTDKIAEELDRMGHSIGIRCMEEFLAKAEIITSTGSSGGSGGGGPGGGGSNTPTSSSHGGTSTAATAGGGTSGTTTTVGGIPTSAAAALIRCNTFTESSEVVRNALRIFLGVSVYVSIQQETASADANNNTTPSSSAYTMTLSENPLTHFVELPDEYKGLTYSQLLAGMIRGMCEMLQYDVTCVMTKSQLRDGADVNEFTVTLQQVLQDGAGEDYQEE